MVSIEVFIEGERVVVDQLEDLILVHHIDGEQMDMEEEAWVRVLVLGLSEKAGV